VGKRKNQKPVNLCDLSIFCTFALKYNLKAKKSYGQHFLVNDSLSQSIVESAMKYSDKYPILEIGPGQGVLTKYLFENKVDFMSVEADSDLVDYLRENYPGIGEHIILSDILRLDLSNVFEEKEFLLFGNYPYNISSQILFQMLKFKDNIPIMIGMFQKEVAERIIAKSGNKQYGILSVLTQAYYTGKITHRIKPGSFNPPPKVDSAVIKLERKENYSLGCNESLFKTVVKMAFNHRRKMMRNTLKPLVNNTEILKLEIFTKRPEQLNVEDFIILTNIIESNSPS